MGKPIKIKPQKATNLTKGQSISNSVFNNFEKNTFPLFFNSYHPDKSFLAVPTTWIRDLAIKANEPDFINKLDSGILEIVEVKRTILKKLGEKAKARHKLAIKSKK